MNDKLTPLEINVYRAISYSALAVCGVCMFFVHRVDGESAIWTLNGIGAVAFVVMGVFGLGVNKNVRVLDLRKFNKSDKATEQTRE
jgi:hypothetical protein